MENGLTNFYSMTIWKRLYSFHWNLYPCNNWWQTLLTHCFLMYFIPKNALTSLRSLTLSDGQGRRAWEVHSKGRVSAFPLSCPILGKQPPCTVREGQVLKQQCPWLACGLLWFEISFFLDLFDCSLESREGPCLPIQHVREEGRSICYFLSP